MLGIKGLFRVNKIRMIQSNIQYVVIFLGDRMVFVKIGGQFADGGLAGAIAGGAIGGALGGLIGASIEQKMQKSANRKKDEKVKSLSDFSIEELLALDKHNFEVSYGDIIRIGMKHSSMSLNGNRTGIFNIEGKKIEKFDIAPNQNYEECEKMVSCALPSKLN